MFTLQKTSDVKFKTFLREQLQTLGQLLIVKEHSLRDDLKNAQQLNLKSTSECVGINEMTIESIQKHKDDLEYIMKAIIQLQIIIPTK